VRLLVVEDDAKLAAALNRGLRHAGYAIDLVGDGDAALLQAAVYPYDAIVLDVMLPMRDGVSVCRTLRARECWTPVLMLTARGRPGDRVHGLDAGADDYLAKPFDFSELLARLRSLTRRVPAERPVSLTVGDLSIDPARHEVRHPGGEVVLTAREFAVLEHLARRAGQVVSRTELLDHVWDSNYPGSTNIVDQYVGALRRKLDGPGAALRIRTVRGVGFVLEPCA
jgi:two-component system, OmpR family, response regulator